MFLQVGRVCFTASRSLRVGGRRAGNFSMLEAAETEGSCMSLAAERERVFRDALTVVRRAR